MRRVRLLDLPALDAGFREELLRKLTAVVDSGRFILGDEVRLLEEEVAACCGASHAVGCASGSDALYLALRAVGVGPGDRVVTPAFTFFATAGSISRTGAEPVFVDIDPETYTLDPAALAEALVRQQPVRAVIPVHLYGGSVDMDPIISLAKEYGCAVIEDGAQAIGAEYKGRPVNAIGAAGGISFFPTKNLGGIGDGGMVITNDPELAETVRLLRVHGSRDKYRHELIGVNSRLDALQAAALRVKLPHLDAWTRRRQENAAAYCELLGDAGLPISLPRPACYQTRHVYNQFVIRCPRRNQLKDYLRDHGIDSEIYYPIPLHRQPCYAPLGYQAGDFPESEKAAGEVLALPVHPVLAIADIGYVCQAIRTFYG